ncbi:MAG TPA: hypothetical protein VGJ84_17585, partial [Polyangiaceae bacterium]
MEAAPLAELSRFGRDKRSGRDGRSPLGCEGRSRTGRGALDGGGRTPISPDDGGASGRGTTATGGKKLNLVGRLESLLLMTPLRKRFEIHHEHDPLST